MSISVGSVSVDIVPDTKNFRRDLNAKLKDLSVDVRANLQDKAFEAELAAATRDKTVNVKVDDRGSIKKMQGQTSALVTTLALLAPAAAPLTAVALGGAVALTGLGAAGFLAFKGIKEEMAEGTPIGVRYSSIIGGLSSDLLDLERVAAKGILTGFDSAASALNGQLPNLRREIGLLTDSLGSDLTPLTRGLLALFNDLFPTTQSIANGIHSLAVGFETWATGAGGRAFAAYLAHELPIVAQALTALANAGVHVVQGLLPLGGPVLDAITGISTAISAIPVNTIRDLFIAFAGYKAITLTAGAIDAVTAAMVRLKIVEGVGGAGGAHRASSSATGTLGSFAKVTGVGTVLAIGTDAAVGVTQGQNAAETKGLANDPAKLAAAQAELARLQAKNASQGVVPRGAALASAQLGRINTLKQEIADAAKLKASDDALKISQGGLAGSVGIATDKMIQQTAATSAWQNALVAVSNPTQDLITANVGLHQAVANANQALKDNGKTLDLNTQKGRNNQTALLAVAVATRTKITTDIDGQKSQEKVNQDWLVGHDRLIKIAEKFGLSAAAAKRYADRLLGIKPLIKTEVVINTAAAMAKVAALKAGLSAIQFYANQKDSGPTSPAKPGKGGSGPAKPPGKAIGGLLRGPGTSTSDSIPLMGSKGEFMVRAAAVQAVGVPFLNKLNASGSVAGGPQGQPQVVQNITTQPGTDNQAVADIVASRLSVVLSR